VTATLESEEGERLELDCKTADRETTRYPLRVRAAATAMADMPVPLGVMPPPKGSTVLPALTQEEIQQLSKEDRLAR
jgi:hypothetical protein